MVNLPRSTAQTVSAMGSSPGERSKKMTLYVVVADGYEFGSYGSEMYLLGVFTLKELAEKCVEENTKKDPYYDSNDKPGLYDLILKIIEVEGDKAFPLVRANDPHEIIYQNDNYIGGYIE